MPKLLEGSRKRLCRGSGRLFTQNIDQSVLWGNESCNLWIKIAIWIQLCRPCRHKCPTAKVSNRNRIARSESRESQIARIARPWWSKPPQPGGAPHLQACLQQAPAEHRGNTCDSCCAGDAARLSSHPIRGPGASWQQSLQHKLHKGCGRSASNRNGCGCGSVHCKLPPFL